MRRVLALALGLLALLAAGCGDDRDATGTAATTGTAPPSTVESSAAGDGEAGCRAAEQPAPKDLDLGRPTEALDPRTTYVVTLTTSCGDIEIRLDQDAQPRTAASFAHLVRERAYDDTTFHRIVPGFVIQGGDPRGDGTGGPGYSVVEAPPGGVRYRRGVVAMAKTQIERPGTSGSQFFIVLDDAAQFEPLYAVAGRVVSGMDVVDRIAAIPTDQFSAPQTPVVIESATLAER
ncbi:MAG TPA: peptidylprolyl isomerase [Capillimicrobium sp.]|nr:peptidylprolyl isomerase [Capillimicrobium sp.]